MKSNKGKYDFSRLLINDSLLPDIFLVRYAQELSKNALLVYLWLNITGKKESFDEADIKRFKIVPDDEIDKILAELMAASLINRKDKTYSFDDIKAREIGELIVEKDKCDPAKFNIICDNIEKQSDKVVW